MNRTELVATLERVRQQRDAARRVHSVQIRMMAEAVRRARAGGMSLGEVAGVLGVSRAYVQKLEKEQEVG